MTTRTPRRAAPPGHEFDEHTPPPRAPRPPTGGPIPAWVALPLGEPVAALFLDWHASGRVPVGSVLCEFVGTAYGGAARSVCGAASGFKVACVPDGNAPARQLGADGAAVPQAELDGYRITTWIKEHDRPVVRYVVMSPKE